MTTKTPLQGDGSESGWRSRGYVPHFDGSRVVQHVTYHLADSLPAEVLARITVELDEVSLAWQDAERRKRMEAWLDAGHGSCLLRTPEAAALVQDAFLHFDSVRYRLLAWVVMPNHIHVLFEPMADWDVARIVASWKSFTGRRLSALRQLSEPADTTPRVWNREYWDRYIRDPEHFAATVSYIHDNPVKAGLVQRPEEWLWSSARRDPPS
jgi:putative transposase